MSENPTPEQRTPRPRRVFIGSNLLVDGPHQQFRPLVYTPLTRLADHWFTYADTKCAPYERTLLRCAYQGSKDHMYKNCANELEDFEECVMKNKQIARYAAIQKERHRQGKFEEPPVEDSYMNNPWRKDS